MKKIIFTLIILHGVLLALYGQNGVIFDVTSTSSPYSAYGGAYAGYSGTSSSANNSFIGYSSGYNNTSGTDNSALGYLSLNSNTSGSYNIAIGSGALKSNVSGTGNTATGYQALYHNTASDNTAFGYGAVGNNSTGTGNTGTGASALSSTGTGQYNTGVGYEAMVSNNEGSYNTAVGYSSLHAINSGNNNTAVGYNAGPYPGGSALSNTTAIGNGAVVGSSNTIVIGNSSITSIGGQVGWSTLSDGRFKTNIKEDVSGLDFIKQLRPVSYTFNVGAFNQFSGVSKAKDFNQQEPVVNATRQTGFIAQEVETAVKNSGLSFTGVVAPQNDQDHYSLRYGDFVVPLVKAVQELSTQLTKQKNQIDSLKKIIANSVPGSSVSVNSFNTSNFLYQNIPNPAGGKTIIPYQLQGNVQGQIFIFDMMGGLKKTIALSNEDKSVEIQNGELNAGLYIYSLVVNGAEVASKRMIIN